jgi:formate C-acetyltransferase
VLRKGAIAQRAVLQEHIVRDSIMATEPTPRIERLREAFVRLRPSYSIDRARIETKVLKGTEGEPTMTRRAKIFAAVVREMPIDIYPDELLVGNPSARPCCINVSPAYIACMQTLASIVGGGAGDDDTEIIGFRRLSDEDRKELQDDILPYARRQGVVPPLYHYGHNAHHLDKVLKKGSLGIKQDAEERLSRIDRANPDDLKKVPFLEGVAMAMDAAAEIGKRFSVRAKETG